MLTTNDAISNERGGKKESSSIGDHVIPPILGISNNKLRSRCFFFLLTLVLHVNHMQVPIIAF